jgi:hypothetical protein
MMRVRGELESHDQSFFTNNLRPIIQKENTKYMKVVM